jgi:hypothetical protein
MKRLDPRSVQDLQALLLGATLGFGTNLVSDPAGWPAVLQPVGRYAWCWLAALLVGVVAFRLRRAHQFAHTRTWTGRGNPYPGLEAFDSRRSGVFFGRTVETQQILERLTRPGRLPVVRFVPIVGASGSGKSSLIQAGVLPALAENGGWRVVGPLMPGTDPVRELARTLVGESGSPGLYPETERLVRLEGERLLLDVATAPRTAARTPCWAASRRREAAAGVSSW